MSKKESNDYGLLRTLIDGLYARFAGLTPTTQVVTDWGANVGGAGTSLPSETPVTLLTCDLDTTANGSIVATAHVSLTNAAESAGAVELILEVDGTAIDITTQTMPENIDYNVTLTGSANGLAAGNHTITVVANASVAGMHTQSGGATGVSITAFALIPSGA